jgi:hypothetical protein
MPKEALRSETICIYVNTEEKLGVLTDGRQLGRLELEREHWKFSCSESIFLLPLIHRFPVGLSSQADSQHSAEQASTQRRGSCTI